MKWMFKEDHSLGEEGGGRCYLHGGVIKMSTQMNFLSEIFVFCPLGEQTVVSC